MHDDFQHLRLFETTILSCPPTGYYELLIFFQIIHAVNKHVLCRPINDRKIALFLVIVGNGKLVYQWLVASWWVR